MKFLFFLFFIFILIGAVEAVGFSPSSFTYELGINETECKTITLTSNSELITLEDRWAENSGIEWKASNFKTSAEKHNLSILYPNELSLNEREINVCISGNTLGEYHGIMLLTENQVGNSVVQVGIWLKVNIIEKTSTTEESETPSSSSSGSTNSGGNSLTSAQETQENSTTEQKKEINQTIDKTTDKNINTKPGITGAVIGLTKSGKGGIIIIVIMAIMGTLIYSKNKKQKLEKIE